MSDFDKEAEREKLREKYENEEAEREATQQMSELLLQGATMTNAHCDEHGDPVFRYDGEEFCPTCRAEGKETVRGDRSDGEDAADATGEADADDDAGRATAEAGGDGTGSGGETDVRSPPADAGDRESGSRPVDSDPIEARSDPAGARADPADSARREGQSGGESAGSRREPDRSRREPDRSGAARRDREGRGSPDDDLAEAEASLRRTLVRFARRAEGTDDPRRAREDLRVAREAAETLAALNDR